MLLLLVGSLLATTIPQAGYASAAAGDDRQIVEEIVVFGRNEDLVGSAETASEGSVAGADLLIRPLVRTAELLESMPGLVAVQHSGSGKANQYFLRGFNLDHGTDYTAFVDGMPLNMRSHGHGQGYLDVNGLIPETVERIDYRKGPYWADLGDFSLAGVSFIHTIDRLDRPFLSVEFGESAWRRIVGGASGDVGGGSLSLVGEYKHYDGPWEHPEALEHVSVWSKYLVDTAIGELSVTLSGYEASWEPTEQVPERVIGSSVCSDEFCSLDDTAEGETSRWIVDGRLLADRWSATLYGQLYDWSMSSNPTYDFQINQFDKRWTLGGQAIYTLMEDTRISLELGGDFRYDHVRRVGLDAYDSGQFVSNISDNQIEEGSVAAFLDGTWHAAGRLRVVGGLRADFYDFDVTALNADSFAGEESDSRASPKVGLAYAMSSAIEWYVNWGKGFHSNDARGVVNDTDPVPGLSSGTGYETGLRAAVGDAKLTAVYWWLTQDSELIFVGDSNSVEPKGGSKRRGLELTFFWQPVDWLGIDAVVTGSRARYTDNPEGSHVEGAVEQSAQVGFTVTRSNWDASARLRYLGPYALVADNSARADGLTTVNLRGARHWESLTFFAEIINLLDSDAKEIVYDYPAYVEGFDPAGLSSETLDCEALNCRMSRATEPRAFRVGASYRF